MPNIPQRKKQIASVRAYLSFDKDIKKILDFCNFECKNDWRVWADDYGNVIKFDKHDALLYLNNKPTLEKTTDLYLYAKPNVLAENSIAGYFEKHYHDENYARLWLLGDNKKLRTVEYVNEKCFNTVPIIFGLTVIKEIINNLVDMNSLIEVIEMENTNLSKRILKSLNER